MKSVHPKFAAIILFIIISLQILIYTPDIGKGFITDDFNWIGNVVIDGEVQYLRPFKETTGFFRPLIGISFGVQYSLHGLNPFYYALFNLAIHLINIILIYILLRLFKIEEKISLIAVFLFSLNTKANIMAVGWISGRTSLLCAAFILITIITHLSLEKYKRSSTGKKTYITTGYCAILLLFLAALLCKETAVALPVFLFFYFCITFDNSSIRQKIKYGFKKSVIYLIPLTLYFLLRMSSDAFTPLNAPAYYKYSFSPYVIIRNFFEYTLRAGLLDIILFHALMILSFLSLRKLKKILPKIKVGIYITGTIWFVVFLLPSVMLSARSDLYAYIPQVGIHIIFSSLIMKYWNQIKERKPAALYATIIILLIISIFWMVYLYQKAEQLALKGSISKTFSRQIEEKVKYLPDHSRIIVVDKDSTKRYAPSEIISYGFNDMLRISFPEKNYTGKIITEHLKKNNNAIYFQWKNKKLQRIK